MTYNDLNDLCEYFEHYERYVHGWKQIPCTACNGSGYYDNTGSPKCGGCDGTGKERVSPKQYKNFEADAIQAGFTAEQAAFMRKYVAMANHCHEYHSDMHDYATSQPITDTSRYSDAQIQAALEIR